MRVIKVRMRYFLSWLMNQRHRDDRIGDFARDVKADKDSRKPRWDSTREDWKIHLIHLGACDAAIDSLDAAWDEFQNRRTQHVDNVPHYQTCKDCMANYAAWSDQYENYCMEHEKHLMECPPASECEYFTPTQQYINECPERISRWVSQLRHCA